MRLDIVFYTLMFIIYSFLYIVNRFFKKYIVFFDFFVFLVYNQL